MWHPYKILVGNIYMHPDFFYPIWAPLQHAFYPGAGVYTKPKLKDMEIRLAVARLAYPQFRARVWNLLHHQPPILAFNHLRNLWLLMEFFLPMVIPFMNIEYHSIIHSVLTLQKFPYLLTKYS